MYFLKEHFIMATYLNCGKFLRALFTTLSSKDIKGTRLTAVPNGKNNRDWIIRSQDSKQFIARIRFRD